jgi:hypothetical protein
VGLFCRARQIAAGSVMRHRTQWRPLWQHWLRSDIRFHTTTSHSGAATPDRAIAALKPYAGTAFRTSLSDEDTAKLQEALSPQEPAAAGV